MRGRRAMAGLLAAVMIMNSGVLSSHASDPQISEEQSAETQGTERTLTDEESGVILVCQAGVLPDDAQLQVDEKKEQEDQDYPAEAKDRIAAELAREGLAMEQISFYDISLGGVQPDGNVEVKLPVPQEWTGQLDAWYVDDNGAVTHMERETEDMENYYTFLTDHFSLYAVSAGSPAKEGEENNAQAAPRSGYSSVAEMAEAYYGETASSPQSAGDVTISTSHTGNTVMAGDLLDFTIAYTMNPAPIYNYGDQAQPLFDTYDNTKIRFRLPDGLTLVDEEYIDNAKAAYDEESGEWVFTLEDASISANASSTGAFSIHVLVKDNGSLEIGKEFDFDIGNNLFLDTAFTVVDRTDSANPVEVKEYFQTRGTITQSLQKLTSVSEDQWGVDKTAEGYTVSEDKKTVTVRYLLKFGLWSDSGSMVTNEASYYAVHGRTSFVDGKVELTDTLSVTGRDGKSISPQSVSVTENFGNKKQYSAENGKTYKLDTDTCGNHDMSGIDAGAPYYSEYYVDAVYDYQKFIADYSDSNTEKLEVKNTAAFTYQLKGASGPVTVSDSASQKIGEVTQPAELTIEKYIEAYDGEGSSLYASGKTWDPVSGAAEFTVKGSNGQAAVLYTRSADGTYTRLSGNTVSIDPAAQGEDGRVTVYLDEGTYQIVETKAPGNTSLEIGSKSVTVGEDGSATVTFTNRELLGGVRIYKTGHRNNERTPLEGAEFGIYTDDKCTELAASGTTGSNGYLQFDRLVPGQYYIRETQAPDGYLADTKVYPVEVKAGEVDTSVQSVNEYNQAHMRLQKQYQWYTTGEWRDVDTANYREFAGCFTLERSLDGGVSWTAVQEGMSLTVNGSTYTVDLPVYEVKEDGSRAAILYRYREVLPENWHAQGETTESDGSRVVYSEPVYLTDVIGNASSSPKTVTMKNSRNGSLELTKEYIRVNAAGTQVTETAKEKEAQFDLYRQVGDGGICTYAGTYQTDASGTVRALDLARTENGEVINYYWVESGADSATCRLESAKKTEITTDGGKTLEAAGPFYFAPKAGDEEIAISQGITVQNVEQKVPVRIRKINTLTGQWMDGAKITITRVEDDGTETEVQSYKDVSVPSAGHLAILEAGYIYHIYESTVPEHYTWSNGPSITVDLTKEEVKSGSLETKYYAIKNSPDPSVTIDKALVRADGTKEDLDGTRFEVYTEAGGDFVPVEDDSGATVILEAGSALYLDPGTYYLHEIVTDTMQVLDPDTYPGLYETYAHTYDQTDKKFFFGPYTVEDEEATQDWGEIENISSLGGLQVTKTDQEGSPLDGAVIGVYYTDGEGKEAEAARATTPDSGKVTFKDLPIYDAAGKKIEYTVREITPPDGYYGTATELSTVLREGEIISTVDGREGADDLTLVNNRYTTFTVNKVYYRVWEHAFTGEEIPLQGTTIALYKRGDDGTYHYVETGVTDSLGQVTFRGLTDEEDDDYVAVEVDVPQDAKDQRVEPAAGKSYLPDPETHESVHVLTKEALEQYNFVRPDSDRQGTLRNEIGWTQLRIDKYTMRREDESDENAPETVKKPANYCQFSLYQQVVAEDDGPGLAFDEANCTLIGKYSSGTFLRADGDPVDGRFATDILETGDNIVYWLVETKAGPGAAIMPADQYILFKRSGAEYTNHSNGGVSTRTEIYPENNYKTYDVENEAVYGPGKDYYAAVRLQKWAGSCDENGNRIEGAYKPLGNARYELWVVNEAGESLEMADQITVGLETDINDPDTEKTAMGVSDALWYNEDQPEEGFAKYDTDQWEEEGNEDDIVWEGEDCYYVRMALRESYVPYGYQIDTQYHYMIVRFTPSGTGITYNDAYFVTGQEEEVPLAEEQTGLCWPGRFTVGDVTEGYEESEENQYRLVNWPLTNFSVTVQKYGYQPGEDAPLSMTAEQMDEYFAQGHTGREPLEGVKMKLQRYDEATSAWRDYDYEKMTWGTRIFETNASGVFTFPQGLDVGQYRIIETEVPDDYELLYDGTAISGGTAARYFRVSSESLVVTMYNPEKISLSLKKTDVAGDPASAQFTLTKTGDSQASCQAQTDPEGEAVFSHIATGTYYLRESSSAYDTSYFNKYMTESYPSLAGFVDPDQGISLGYARALGGGGNDVIVSDILDLADHQVTEPLVVRNPDLVSLEIEKTDTESKECMKGVSFAVYYQAFEGFSGPYAVKDMAEASNRTLVGTYETDAQGKITLEGQKPGVYYIVETKTPDGYEAAQDPDRIVALTGGMDVQVTGADEVYLGGGDAKISFENQRLASICVSKTVDPGEFQEGPDSYSAVFKLYDSADGTEPIATKTATDKEDALFTGLSKGHTYYLEEQGSSEYVVKTVKAGDQEIQADEKGRYAVAPATGLSPLEVEVTNTWLCAQVTIQKIDGENGTPLEGARFRLDYADGRPVPEGQVTWTAGDDGTYTALVRLDKAGDTVYKIQEILAPEGYLVTSSPIEITLSPGRILTYSEWESGDTDAQMLAKRIMPNYNGVTIRIQKYGNTYGSEYLPAQSGVTFRLYTYDEDTKGYQMMDSQETDDKGIATFEAVPAGFAYAVSEETVPSGYAGLDGIWTEDGTKIDGTVEWEGQTLYVLDEEMIAGETYTYSAYNIPDVELEVRKKDGGSGTELIPRAKVSVYEVPGDTAQELTREEVEGLEKPENLVKTVDTTKSGIGYSYMDGITVVPGKTYLVVEDQVVGTSGYDTMILDDSRVKWYQVLTIPKGTVAKQTVTLENILGKADVTIEKESIAQSSRSSLFEAGSEIIYRLSPQVDNTYSLDGFTVTDKGLTACHGEEQALDYDEYLSGRYSIGRVSLGQTSHDTDNYVQTGGHPEAEVIYARVIFIGFDGQEYLTEPVNVSEGEKVVQAPSGEGVKYAQVRVEYYSEGLRALTGYALGQNFKPGDIEVTVALDRQEGAEGKQSLDRVVNTAQAQISYRPWDETGIQSQAPVTEADEDDASNTFGQEKAPEVSVEKRAEDSTVNLNNGKAVYTLRLENESQNEEAMEDPMLIDLLPAGMTVDTDTTFVRITGDNPSGLTAGLPSVVPVGETSAVVLNLSGELKQGDSVEVQLEATVTNAAARYGTNMENYIFATSDVRGVLSDENPNAASFKNTNGTWAEELTAVAVSLGVPAEEAHLLKNALGTGGAGAAGDYGYIGARADVSWFSSSAMTLVKENKGDRDSSYSSSRLARTANGGEIDYRLTVNNTSSTDNRIRMTVMDLLPQEGDLVSGGTGRYSAWPAYLTGGISVALGKETLGEGDYAIYYYTGEIPSPDSGDCSSFFGAVQEAQEKCPEGWVSERPADDTKIRAFIVAVAEGKVLETGESLVVQYSTKVTDEAGNIYTADELEDISYLNAVNNFQCYYDSYPASSSPEQAVHADRSLESNSVSATIVPQPVKVGGHVWIDADGNGWKDGETIKDYSDYAIVKDLLKKIEIRLYTYRNNTPGMDTIPDGQVLHYNQNSDPDWYTNANYVFDGLEAGLMTVDEDSAYLDGLLQVQHLKGDQPATYVISASIPNTVTGHFKLTEMQGSGRSRNPEGIPDKETQDSNFTNYPDISNRNMSERFYLWPTDVSQDGNWDNTKDVGLVLCRDLKITKQSELPSADPVDGAQFAIYGPFDEGEGKNADLTKMQPVYSGRTENGTFTAEDLKWFKEYVIVETGAAQGYEIDGADASGNENVEKIGEGRWLLNIPDTDSMVTCEEITITNVRETEVQLQAQKNLEGKEPKGNDFQFELLGSDGQTVLQTVTNDDEGTISFEPETVQGVGTHTYYIRESIPEEAQENGGKLDGITYDDTVYEVHVITKWNEEKQTLEIEDVQYYANESQTSSAGGAVFTNLYNASTTWTPVGTKTLTGRDMKAGESFGFTVKEDGKTVGTGTATGGTDGQLVGISFTEISYDLEDAGDHTYTITENGGGSTDSGVAYDGASFEVKVHVSDNGDGTMTAAADYPDGADKVTFVNRYEPTPITYTPAVTKTVAGNKLPADRTFSFRLAKGSFSPEDGAQMPEDAGAQVKVEEGGTSGTVTDHFGEITFRKAGTYTFTIQENAPDLAGFENYDKSVWTLTVTVEDDGNGTLTRKSAVYAKEGEESSQAAAFSNTYDPADAKVRLKAAKIVNSDLASALPAPLTFTFEQSCISGTETGAVIMPEGTDANRVSAEVSAIGREVATPEFGEITFTDAGDYVFQIREVIPAENEKAAGVTYDGTCWYARVSVTDENGTLKAGEPVYYKTDPADPEEKALFENSYMTTQTEMTPTVRKTLEGDTPPQEKTFTFELTADSDNEEGAQITGEKGEALEKGTAAVTYNKVTGTQLASFDKIRFTRAGTYRFNIAEVPDTGSAAQGYTFDTEEQGPWTLTVTVQDDGGALSVKSAVYTDQKGGSPEGQTQAAEFTNSYQVTETACVPKVKKQLAGDAVPSDKTFVFTLERNRDEEDEDTPADGAVLGAAETRITGEGSGSFDTITFEQAGTYHFTIREDRGTDAGYTYDESVWDLEIPVEDKDGSLQVTGHTYTKVDGGEETSEEEAAFTNTYEVTPTGYVPQVTKAVTGDVPEDKDATFRFQIAAREDNPEGAVLPEETEVSITGSGEAQFGEITFQQAGTYRFDITEINDLQTGYQYDGSVWTLTVTVKDTESILSVESAVYSRDETAANTAVFENHYEPKEAAYAPRVQKHLSGDQTSEHVPFEFILEAREDNPEGAVLTGASAKVEGAGAAAFAPITFSKAGTYRFDIRERDGKEAGYTYDSHVWTLTVEVGDAEGVLTVTSVKYDEPLSLTSSTEAAEFINSYNAAEASGAARTGDSAPWQPLTAALILSGGAIMVICRRRKNKWIRT